MIGATRLNADGLVPPVAAEIGRAKAIIVFDNGGNPKATITPIIARVVPGEASEMRFTGVVPVEDDVISHANEVVLPLVDRICELLGVSASAIDAEMVNVGVASSSDKAVRVSGLSAELPLFLAALSTRLQLPVPQDVVATGHIGSLDGDVRIVRNMLAKLKAATDDPSVSRFVCPSLDADISMQALKAVELSTIQVAISEAESRLSVLQVKDIAEAIRIVFHEDAIALAGLRAGYFDALSAKSASSSTSERAARYLSQDGRRRFLEALMTFYLQGDMAGVADALNMWATVHCSRSTYPSGFGRDLLFLLASLPPSTRLTEAQAAGLVPVSLCSSLSKLVTSPDDEEDIKLLFRAASGVWFQDCDHTCEDSPPDGYAGESVADRTVRDLVTGMGAEHLARTIGAAIDDARESFRLDSSRARTYQEFRSVIVSFYVHLERVTGRAGGTTSLKEATAQALKLVNNAFSRVGGYKAAWAEAQSGTRGGLGHVLNECVQQYKLEKIRDHVDALFAAALDPLDWEAKVAVVGAIQKRYPSILPPARAGEPPGRFAETYKDVLRACVRSVDDARQFVRAL